MFASYDMIDEPISERPTRPPEATTHSSGTVPRGTFGDEASFDRRPSHPGDIDVCHVPLIVDRRPLHAHPPGLVTSMLIAAMNGVLTVADLSEITGIPLGAIADSLRELEGLRVVVLLRAPS
jgi:hypothetical protein